MEIEINKSIKFVDIPIDHKISNKFKIFRKEPDTDNIMPYLSSHPLNIKAAVYYSSV